MYKSGLLFFILFISLNVNAQFVGIIPQPQEVVEAKDSLSVKGYLNIAYGSETNVSTIQYVRKELANKFQLLSATNSNSKTTITFRQSKSKTKTNGAYSLTVNDNGIFIEASTPEGFLYGASSLIQLLSYHQSKSGIKIPYVKITDEPSNQWRGFMLDESRHFFGKEKVKQLLDWMAFYKLNKFHWHLTDEPAWRIEIKQYPFLTLVGGVGNYTNPISPAQYYTQEDIREIVSYASDLQIEVIPEIDMPGHATASNRAYPQFSGGGTKDHPDFTFHPAKEGTYQYLNNILQETNNLFPSNMLHLGGDEVSYGSDAWNQDLSIQKLKADKKLENNKAVETYFMQRMADSVYAMGAKVLVWDEMAEADLPRDKTIQFYWRHDKPAQLDLLLKNGFQVIICPRIPFYFDFVQEDSHRYGRKWNKDFNSLSTVYHFDMENIKAKETFPNQILGLQGNLWTERVTDTDRFDFMVFPRISALAESAWTNKNRKNFANFQTILRKHLLLYKSAGLYYFDPFNPQNNPEPNVNNSTKKYIDNPE
ncbi:beta-N-acetylhexosaminidase [Sphingobacterium hungaricum]|uniref:beta-N-acetylhexosaminidase n=1 Tax=Sphingobacterium hungaricum TaxID=2082723 RepID=A0A928UZN6_9SPHI|nr:beta-N-acetylhexosaminidase [Sphingobacterium hungaricum]MBE8715038.1 beta-hexosaminidase [Sphingobacterium hungaricum]